MDLRKLQLLFLFVGCATVRLACAQTTQDSLLSVLKTNPNETITFQIYKRLGEENLKTNSEVAKHYFLRALSLPFHSQYAEAFVLCYQSLGSLYETSGVYDSSFLMYRQSLLLSLKFNLKKETGLAYQGMGIVFLRKSMLDSSYYYLNKMLSEAIERKDEDQQSSAYNNLGNVYSEEGKYPDALEKYLKAIPFYEKRKDEVNLSKVLANVGNIENIIGQYDKAIEYTRQAIVISEKIGNMTNSAYCHQLLGRIYRKQHQLPQALAEYRSALALHISLNNRAFMSATHNSMGNIYYEQNKFTDALREYAQSNQIARQIRHLSYLAYSYSSLGNVWYQLKNSNKATRYLDSSITAGRQSKNRYLVMDAYELKSQIYSDQHKFEDALQFHKQFSLLKDSLTTEENHRLTQEIEAKYQNEKKQDEILLLQKNKLLQDISLRQSRTSELTLVLLFVAIIIIGLLVFNRQKMINRANRQMEIEKIRNQIARDLHDDMGSTLSSINIFSQLGAQKESDPALGNYFLRIGEHASKMMENMADMVWSVNPDNDSFQKTVAKMKEFCSEILEPKNITYRFEIEESLYALSLPSDKRKNLFLIFKEAINNAAKYSQCHFILIVLQQNENRLILSVHDDGKGVDLTQPTSGNGLRNMKERTVAMNGHIDISSLVNEGVTIQVMINIA